MSQLALTSIALIAVVDGNVGQMTSSAIHAAVTAASQQIAGVRVLTEEEMFVGSDDATRDTVLACGADVVCLAAVVRRFNARFGLIAAAIEVRDAPALIVLRLIDAEKASAIATDSGVLSPSEGDVKSAIRARTIRLFERAGYRTSPLIVRIAPPEIEVLDAPASPWLWIAIAGAAIAGGSIAVFAATRSSPQCICFETSDGTCPGCQ